jgi:hypothetical protein
VFDNGENIPWLLAYPDAERKPILTPFVVYPAARYGYQGFTVELPEEIFNDEDKKGLVKRLVDSYRFAGTKYKLILKEN